MHDHAQLNNHAAFCSHRIRPHIISGLLRIVFTLGFPASDLRSLFFVYEMHPTYTEGLRRENTLPRQGHVGSIDRYVVIGVAIRTGRQVRVGFGGGENREDICDTLSKSKRIERQQQNGDGTPR